MKKWLSIVVSFCVASAALATEEVFYLAGELPPPAKIEKVLSAGNPADVLLLSSTPNKLLGLAGFNMEKRGKLFSAARQALPTLGKIAGKGSTLSPEKIVALQPNLII
ncbi:MAG: iron ABC transporter substrate-binding protein, partial [Haemophilus parainfluenzae]|nr:iron ABC transporter substrate-binding protein [Haemophilus parainfluenzae]